MPSPIIGPPNTPIPASALGQMEKVKFGVLRPRPVFSVSLPFLFVLFLPSKLRQELSEYRLDQMSVKIWFINSPALLPWANA